MTKISKDNAHQSRHRVKIFRAVQSIMKQDEADLRKVIDLRQKILKPRHVNNHDSIQPSNLKESLRSWAINYHIQQKAVTALLKILISVGFTSLPSDSRALMKTPRTVDIENRAGGQYWHNGLSNCLSRIFAKLTSNIEIQLNFNIDGLPLFNSSPIGFWPILANIHEMPDIKPMIIAIWSGISKPNNLNDFLQPLVNEINEVVQNGITINGYRIEVLIRAFLCDSPARSFLKGFFKNQIFHLTCINCGAFFRRGIFQS